MSANANIIPYQFGDDYLNEFIHCYLKKYSSKNLWNETQLTIIFDAIVPMIETIIDALRDFPGSAIYLLQLFKKANCTSKESEIEDKSICEVIIDISFSEGNIDLKRLAGQFWPLHHLCLGKFLNYKFHLEDFQTDELSKEQEQSIHEIIDEHLEKAITELSKLKNQSYHPLLKPPEENTSASPQFFSPLPSLPGKRKRESNTSTEKMKDRKIEISR